MKSLKTNYQNLKDLLSLIIHFSSSGQIVTSMAITGLRTANSTITDVTKLNVDFLFTAVQIKVTMLTKVDVSWFICFGLEANTNVIIFG